MGYFEVRARLWYPQLDVYDCVRRMGAILASIGDPPGLERLYIADFFLANPPLLHRCQMTQGVRKAFWELEVPRPEAAFLIYPAPPLLFKKMEPVQKEAILAMAGKGLLGIDEYQRGIGMLTASGELLCQMILRQFVASEEEPLIRFLTHHFVTSGEFSTEELRQRTALRRSVW